MTHDIFELRIYANPVAQARPRFARTGNFVKTYDPAKSVNWKRMVNAEAQRRVRETNFKMFPAGIPLVASFEFIFQRPPSVSAKKRPHHTVKPDLDNLIKGCKDALRNVVYFDDAQIVSYAHALKRYVSPDSQPGVIIKIWQKELTVNQ
jgi:Holliday junction resolvase RusA-like endonuclease